MIVTAAACRLDTLIEISYACGHQVNMPLDCTNR